MQKENSDSSKTRREKTKDFIDKKKDVIKTKGIYVLPSLFTVGNIFCGFYAIITLFSHINSPNPDKYLVRAALLILASAILDGMDGRVAKLTKTTSEFGVQLDSLSDVISFGVAPGLLVYVWALMPYKRYGWLPAFLLLVCGALRLARFNVQSSHGESNKYFKGLPIPFAAIMIASSVLLSPSIAPKSFLSLLILFMVYGLAYLMISTIPYRSFKEIDLHEKKSAKVIFLFTIFLIIILIDPPLVIFVIIVTYILSGPLRNLIPASFNIDKTIHRDILFPPEDFDDPVIRNKKEGSNEN